MRMSYLKFLYSVFLFSCFASSTSSYSFYNTTKCSVEQSYSLLLFKQSLFSINDTLLESTCKAWLGSGYHPIMMNWNTSIDCCIWDGVTCDHFTGDVIGIDLSCGMLQGTIHPNTSLFGLPRLKRLNLAFNQFYHSKLPSEIGRFSNSLTHLNISQCWFSGDVPTDITLLSKLVSLDLSDNRFDLKLHVLKDMFQNFTNLEELSLGRVDISSILPTSLNISSSLKLLNLGSTGLYGILPHNIFNIHSLETLDLSQNSFTGDIPREISFLPNLVSLDLSGSWNDYFRIQPHVFENLLKNSTLLRYLSLNQVYIGSVLPSYLIFTSLKSLDLSSTTLQGKLTDNVFNLQNLEVLKLSYNNLSGPLPKSVVNSTHLTYLDLSYNKLNGALPSRLFTLPSLEHVSLHHNLFSRIEAFESFAIPSLKELDLSYNHLAGHIDVLTFRQFTNLTHLDLSYNNFSGYWELDTLLTSLTNLEDLSLSYSGLSVTTMNGKHYVNPGFRSLGLASCKLKVFPKSFRAMQQLQSLDLSSNEIRGRIPLWAGEIGGKSGHHWLTSLDLSHNFITGLPQFGWFGLLSLSLQSNLIQGPFPPSICNMSNLWDLDMSNNRFNGTIPQCIGKIISSLLWMDLGTNHFQGNIPNICKDCGHLVGIVLNGNQLSGEVPSSLSECQSLSVLDLGNNHLNGTFPNWLGDLPSLQVLVLKSNNFHGSIVPSSTIKFPFPSLKFLDLSHNGFVGQLPAKYFQNFVAMKTVVIKSGQSEYWNFGSNGYSFVFVVKGSDQVFPKLLIDFSLIDLSKNNFEKEIPENIGNLSSLKSLNLSHNSLNGRIPGSLGKLSEIESLDLSWNQLTGEIPQSLAGIKGLGVLNLSQNRLNGHIPEGTQFNTFDESSFKGNLGLCGFPLAIRCNERTQRPQIESQEDREEESGFTWEVVMLGYGCGTLVGLVMGYLMLSTRKVKWFNAIADALESLVLKKKRRHTYIGK